MHKLLCRLPWSCLSFQEMRIAYKSVVEAQPVQSISPAEKIIDENEQKNLENGANSVYVQTPQKAEQFIRDNAQDAIAAIAKQLSVRDTFGRELEANDVFMYQAQLKVAEVKAKYLSKLHFADAQNAEVVLPILTDTATELQKLIGTDNTLGIVSNRADGKWWNLGIGPSAAISDELTNYKPEETIQSLVNLLPANPPWNTDEYEVRSTTAEDVWWEAGNNIVSVKDPDPQYAKPKIDLIAGLMEIAANPVVAQELTDHPNDNQIFNALKKWIVLPRTEGTQITTQDVTVFIEKLKGIRDTLEATAAAEVRESATKLTLLYAGVLELKKRFSDFNPMLTSEEDTLLNKTIVGRSDVKPIDDLQVKIVTAAQTYLSTNFASASLGIPQDIPAFSAIQSALAEVATVNSTMNDPLSKLTAAGDHLNLILKDYQHAQELQKKIDDLKKTEAEHATAAAQTPQKITNPALEEDLAKTKAALAKQKELTGELLAQMARTNPIENPATEQKAPSQQTKVEDYTEELHDIATYFFRELNETTGERFPERVLTNLRNQNYTAIEQFAGDRNPNLSLKDIKERFKESGLQRLGLFLEPKERLQSYRFACLIVGTLDRMRDLGFQMHIVLPNDSGSTWNDVRGSMGAVMDQLSIFLKYKS